MIHNRPDNGKPAPSMVTVAHPIAEQSPQTLQAPAPDTHAIMESVLMRGDLSKLTVQERNAYYMETCRSLGLNPLTKPFDYIELSGKTVLYAKRDCTDQLRKKHGISIEVVSLTQDDAGYITAHVRATDSTGRRDEDYGVVNLGKLFGEARANAVLKCVTKAKRRVTLSICGLGMLDETEVADIPVRDRDGLVPVPGPDDVPNIVSDPPKPKTFSRAASAITNNRNYAKQAAAMQHELEICISVPELDATACDIETREDYKCLPYLKMKDIEKTYAATLARLTSGVLIDEDGERPPEPGEIEQ